MSTRTKLTYDDYAALPDDGKRYEVLAGELHMTPSPGFSHQRAVGQLFRQLAQFFEENGLGMAFVAPFDVIAGRHDVFVPDITVVCDPSQISPRGIEGAPTLVVEVLSPSNRGYDRGLKARRYLEMNVQHYWVVDPDEQHLVCQRAEHGSWVVVAEGHGHETVRDPSWPDLTIDLARLWK